jgi:predicted dienelactone hydrolase
MQVESSPVRFIAVILAFLLTFAAIAHAADSRVQTVLGEWRDSTRNNRVVPYKIYYPADASGERPVVIFSHGLGGNREGSEFLLSYLADHGYVAVAVQHPGSDTPAVLGDADGKGFQGSIDRDKIEANIKQATSPSVALDRFKDIPFAINMLTEMNAHDATLRGRLDLQHLGMSGHSYGAVTTQALVGQHFPMGMSFADPRIKAGVIYSPSKPRRGDAASAFADVRIPTFHMTGTEDKSPIAQAEMSPEERLQPYQAIHTADKYLLVLTGGDHMVFSGRDPRSGPNPKYPRFHELVQRASLAFWDAYLLGKPDAKAYLTGGSFAHDLGDDGRFEFELH